MIRLRPAYQDADGYHPVGNPAGIDIEEVRAAFRDSNGVVVVSTQALEGPTNPKGMGCVESDDRQGLQQLSLAGFIAPLPAR